MRHDMSRRAFATGAALCAAGAASALAGCGSSAPASALPRVSFCTGCAPTPYDIGVYLAIDQGYFEESGLAVDIVQSDGDTSPHLVVNSGDAQFGACGQADLAACFAIDEPASIIAVASVTVHSTAGLVSLSASGISGYGSLPGHSLLQAACPIIDDTALRLVELTGSKRAQVELCSEQDAALSPTRALIEGRADAISGLEGWDVFLVQAAGERPVFELERALRPELDGYPSLIIANDAYLVSHPDESCAFIEALARGYFYAAHNPTTAAAIMLDMHPQLDGEAVDLSLEYLSAKMFDAQGQWGFIDWDRWDAYFAWLHENGIIDRSIPSHHGFTNDYLEGSAS